MASAECELRIILTHHPPQYRVGLERRTSCSCAGLRVIIHREKATYDNHVQVRGCCGGNVRLLFHGCTCQSVKIVILQFVTLTSTRSNYCTD